MYQSIWLVLFFECYICVSVYVSDDSLLDCVSGDSLISLFICALLACLLMHFAFFSLTFVCFEQAKSLSRKQRSLWRPSMTWKRGWSERRKCWKRSRNNCGTFKTDSRRNEMWEYVFVCVCFELTRVMGWSAMVQVVSPANKASALHLLKLQSVKCI